MLLATLAVVVVAFVLHPVFAASAPAGALVATDKVTRELYDLEDKKMRLYDALQDLEFEKDSGKISDADFESARTDYLAQVSQVIARMDEIAPTAKKTAKAKPKKKSKQADEVACASCGESNPKSSKFCLECGAAFGVQCASCGESLPDGAKFCNECGEKVAS